LGRPPRGEPTPAPQTARDVTGPAMFIVSVPPGHRRELYWQPTSECHARLVTLVRECRRLRVSVALQPSAVSHLSWLSRDCRLRRPALLTLRRTDRALTLAHPCRVPTPGRTVRPVERLPWSRKAPAASDNRVWGS